MCTFGADCTNYRQIRPFKLFVVHIYFGALKLRELQFAARIVMILRIKESRHNTNYANQEIVRQGREEPLYLCQLGTFGAL